MPWPVYSERIFHHQAKGYWAFTVPAHKRLIITNCDVVNAAVGAANYSLNIGPILLSAHFFQAQWQTDHAVLKAVAYQGEVVELGISVDGVYCTVTGSLLEDPSNATGPPASASQLPATPDHPWERPS